MTTFEDFHKLDIRVGKIIEIELLSNAKYTTHKLTIDFGSELGRKVSCARLVNYSKEHLLGKLVTCVVNLPEKQIGKTVSQALTLGALGEYGECVLLQPDSDVPLGGKVY